MTKSIRVYVLFFLLFVLANCGFQPIYKTTDYNLNISDYSVKYQNDPSYIIKNKIQEIFNYSSSDSMYIIDLNAQQRDIPLIINTNGTVSKYRVEIIMYFNVYENDSDNKIFNDIVRGFAEYLVQTSEIQTSEKHKQAIEIATQEAVQMMSIKIQSNISQSQ